MTTFSVDPAALQALAGRLRRTGAELTAAGRTLRAEAASGAPNLDAAIDDLVRVWRRELERTADAAARTGAQLEAAATTYADVDSQVARACP